MEIFLVSRIMLLTLATLAIFAVQIFGLDDTSRSHLYRQEVDDEDFSESNEDILEDTQRSVNSGEETDRGGKNLVKMSVPMMNRMTNAAANLPLRFGRAFLEEKNNKLTGYSPQRYGKAFEERIPKSVPNLPQRFGRYLSSKRSIQPLANLPQRFGRASSAGQFIQSLANLPQRFGRSMALHKLSHVIVAHPLEGPDSGYGDNRMPDVDNPFDEETKEDLASPINWNPNHNQMVM